MNATRIHKMHISSYFLLFSSDQVFFKGKAVVSILFTQTAWTTKHIGGKNSGKKGTVQSKRSEGENFLPNTC